MKTYKLMGETKNGAPFVILAPSLEELISRAEAVDDVSEIASAHLFDNFVGQIGEIPADSLFDVPVFKGIVLKRLGEARYAA